MGLKLVQKVASLLKQAKIPKGCIVDDFPSYASWSENSTKPYCSEKQTGCPYASLEWLAIKVEENKKPIFNNLLKNPEMYSDKNYNPKKLDYFPTCTYVFEKADESMMIRKPDKNSESENGLEELF